METAGLIGLVSVLGGLAAIGATGKDIVRDAAKLVEDAKQGAQALPVIGVQGRRPLFGTSPPPPTAPTIAEVPSTIPEPAPYIASTTPESAVLDRLRQEKSTSCLPEGQLPPEGEEYISLETEPVTETVSQLAQQTDVENTFRKAVLDRQIAKLRSEMAEDPLSEESVAKLETVQALEAERAAIPPPAPPTVPTVTTAPPAVTTAPSMPSPSPEELVTPPPTDVLPPAVTTAPSMPSPPPEELVTPPPMATTPPPMAAPPKTSQLIPALFRKPTAATSSAAAASASNPLAAMWESPLVKKSTPVAAPVSEYTPPKPFVDDCDPPRGVPVELPGDTKMVKARGDGWCFYRAVLKGLEENPVDDTIDAGYRPSQQLAEQIRDWLLDHRDQFEVAFNTVFKLEEDGRVENGITLRANQRLDERGISAISKRTINVDGRATHIDFETFARTLPEVTEGTTNPRMWADLDTDTYLGKATASVLNITVAVYIKPTEDEQYKLFYGEECASDPLETASRKVVSIVNDLDPSNPHFNLLRPIETPEQFGEWLEAHPTASFEEVKQRLLDFFVYRSESAKDFFKVALLSAKRYNKQLLEDPVVRSTYVKAKREGDELMRELEELEPSSPAASEPQEVSTGPPSPLQLPATAKPPSVVPKSPRLRAAEKRRRSLSLSKQEEALRQIAQSPKTSEPSQTIQVDEEGNLADTSNPLPQAPIGDRAPTEVEVNRATAFLQRGVLPPPFKNLQSDEEYAKFMKTYPEGDLKQKIKTNWEIVNYNRFDKAATRLFPKGPQRVGTVKAPKPGGMRKNTFRRRRGVTTKRKHVRRTSYRKNRANRPHSNTRRRT